MPSARRSRLLLIVIVAVFFTVIFTSRLREASGPDAAALQQLYQKTKTALDKARADGQAAFRSRTGAVKGHVPLDKDADGDVDEDDEILAQEMSDRLRAAEQKAKDLANSKSPNKPDLPRNVVGVGSSAGGQVNKPKEAVADVATGADNAREGSSEAKEVDAELDSILHKSPVIIFSKSYCPYSKRAKGVLLEKYVIEPAPFVVELDQHPLGAQIQARLADMTGRKTVPNIMVSGKSIGGSDEIGELDKQKELSVKVRALGGKRITMKERFVEQDAQT